VTAPSAAAALPTVPVPSCPLCGSGERRLLGERPDTLVPELNRWLPPGTPPLPAPVNRLVACAGCGHVYLDPRLAPGALARVYDLWYRHAYPALWGDDAALAERRREFRRYHLGALTGFAAKPGTLLDVGCGIGLFVDVAARAGWRPVGLDFDEAAVAFGRRRFAADLRVGHLADFDPGARFDAVTLFDYLEHSEAPRDDLAAAAARLAPGGLLVVRVPNRAGWQARAMGADWLAVICNHLNYFDGPGLRRALAEQGLDVLRVAAGNCQTEADIVRRRLRWLRRRLAGRGAPLSAAAGAEASGLAAGRAGAAGALGRIARSLWIEQVDQVGGWFGRGNNLFAVARRPA